MKKPSAYEVATHKGRQADEAQSPGYCGSCSIEVHCTQVRNPKSWVHSSIKRWEKLGGWNTGENVGVKPNGVQRETVETLKAERAELAARKAGQGEAVLVEAVAVTKENEDGELYLDWLLEGGISALESAGTTLLVARVQVTDDTGNDEVYIAPPATADSRLVPVELLERLIKCYEDGMSIYGECEELRALLAQSESKGVKS